MSKYQLAILMGLSVAYWFGHWAGYREGQTDPKPPNTGDPDLDEEIRLQRLMEKAG